MLRIVDHHDHLVGPRSRDSRSVPDVVIHKFYFFFFTIFTYLLSPPYQVSGTRQTLIHKKISFIFVSEIYTLIVDKNDKYHFAVFSSASFPAAALLIFAAKWGGSDPIWRVDTANITLEAKNN